MNNPREEFIAGIREVAPVLIGTMPFGFVTGVAAISAGMSAFEGIALSVLSFSGIAQLIVAQLVAAGSPILLTIAAAFVVSLRFLMYSAAVAPHVAHLPAREPEARGGGAEEGGEEEPGERGGHGARTSMRE